jgi:AcrR family transcriptional regulator
MSSTGTVAANAISPAGLEPVRRHLTKRQAALVEGLVDATVEEIRADGYEGLTVRNVARRAGVAPATAYTYFASKDHLIAEVFWRRLSALPPARVDRRRGGAALADVGLLVAGEPELAAACTTAILSRDPDVKRVRDRIGSALRQRLRAALGDDVDPVVAASLELALQGALLQAGMGYLAYGEVSERVADAAALLVGERP